MIALLFCLILPTTQASLTFVANPDTVDQNVANSSVTVTCTNDGAAPVVTVQNLVIETQLYGDWGVFAQINAGDTQPTLAFTSATATGNVGGAGQSSQLAVTLSAADAGEKYRCRASGLDSSSNQITDTATTDITVISSGGCCDALADIDSRLTDVETAVASGSSGGSGGGSGTVIDATTLKNINGDDLFRLLHWPEGRYALLMADTGCPFQEFNYINWYDTGYRQFHTESTSPTNMNELSEGIHLKQPIQIQSGNDKFIYLYFCVDVSLAEKGPEWPQGSYCIMMYGSCPDNFHQGYMRWDEENTLHKNAWGGTIPTASFGGDTLIHFCCRRDANPNQAVILPLTKPFYLFRFMGECQQVVGARVVNEYVVFDTEDTGTNIDLYQNDYHPDGQLRNVRVELCYYERDV